MTKVLSFTKYDRKGASSRLRSIQYFEGLYKNGIEITHKALFDDSYLVKLYSGQKVLKSYIFLRYLRRFISLFSVWKYDVIWIEKELFPWLPFNIERVLAKLGVKYIVDYDDAIFHNYDLHRKKIVRSLLSSKIPSVMKHAKVVTVCNEYLKDKAVVSGASDIRIIPTVVDLDRYDTSKNIEDTSSTLKIGWIGSPSTEKYLIDLLHVFETLALKIDMKILIVGGKTFHSSNVPYEHLEWSQEKEVKLIKSFDIGIMPLSDSSWERGKCGYKLIQYMACSKPVVASAVGMNCEIIQDGENGYLVDNDEEWIEAFMKLNDEKRRNTFAKEARALVEKKYSLAITMQSRVDTIMDVL